MQAATWVLWHPSRGRCVGSDPRCGARVRATGPDLLHVQCGTCLSGAACSVCQALTSPICVHMAQQARIESAVQVRELGGRSGSLVASWKAIEGSVIHLALGALSGSFQAVMFPVKHGQLQDPESRHEKHTAQSRVSVKKPTTG